MGRIATQSIRGVPFGLVNRSSAQVQLSHQCVRICIFRINLQGLQCARISTRQIALLEIEITQGH